MLYMLVWHYGDDSPLWGSMVSSAFSGTFQLAFLGLYLERECWGRVVVIPG